MRLRDKARFLAMLPKLLRSQWWNKQKISAYQQSRLVKVMKYAVEHVPFYAALGIAPRDIRSAGDLQRFPIVTKADLQERGEQFLSRTFDRDRLRRSLSSGMTGEPTITYFDDASWLLTKYALKARRALTTAKSLRQRILIVSEQANRSSPPVVLQWFLTMQGMSLTTDLHRNLEILVQFAPTMIYGFPSYLLALADTAAEVGVALPRVPLICTSSEMLTAVARSKLEKAFEGRLVDVYGSTEFKEIAIQCAQGRYHINFESVYVESARDAKHDVHRLLITTLVNRAMPLLRYELGDTGRVEEAVCACGRHSPHVTDLHGRLSEILLFPDGTRLSPYVLTTAIEQEPRIKHFRVVHEQPWVVRIETYSQPSLSTASQQELAAAITSLLPKQVSLRFVELPDRGERGKRRAVSREF